MGSIPSPPKKRSKPLLLEAPSGDEGISESNKFTYQASGTYNSDKPPTEESIAQVDDAPEEEDDGDDDFARMVTPQASESDDLC